MDNRLRLYAESQLALDDNGNYIKIGIVEAPFRVCPNILTELPTKWSNDFHSGNSSIEITATLIEYHKGIAVYTFSSELMPEE